MTLETTVLDGADMARTLARIAHEIVEGHPDPDSIVLVGIHTRGALLAGRLQERLSALLGTDVPLGDLDIAFYRDDLGEVPDAPVRDETGPVIHATHLDGIPLEGRSVVLVDDVLFTGRTIRAAIEAIFDYGRPGRVQLAVLVDRGHRELPIRADYVGKNLPTSVAERVNVRVAEIDGRDEVAIERRHVDPPSPTDPPEDRAA
ncbi:bifunctional pyr operon transcriptional regulator/uracil phosphoribosyltransferase PyrR [Patulibacter sp.]|uniref:bifunctional pyr operon transcriptional regulator/uracil phosphoribosyltransferase PyrR n=1 Tax=Patulibacter sp. TaxID=1912859 RepID=UPI002727A9CF|nr:bifunctional pyr operon transcriptional regulator/uracil phosphoribosyltransferase PyrR [Patulibacter sp.]MDO9408578.1 bifunctional pyr operon transcriptional regulator/uracil phosphoribosyltransferase PyrR [Patulibacter sp.]